MSALTGPFMVAMVLLFLAGVAKVRSPVSTTTAMRLAGLPGNDGLTRLLGVLEVMVAVSAVAWANPAPAVVGGLLYLGFTGFVVRALRQGTAIQSCGCFGKTDTPPSAAHVVVNIAAAVVTFGYASAVTAPSQWVATESIPLIMAIAVGSYLTYVLLAVLPATRAAARS